MSAEPSNFVIEEYPSSKFLKKNYQPLSLTSKNQKLPEKDLKFIEELKKREKKEKPEKNEKNSKIKSSSVLKENQKNPRGFSVNFEKARREKRMSKNTTASDFKNSTFSDSKTKLPVALAGSQASLEKKNLMDSCYKYFIGPGNNDSLVKRLLSERSGWIKTFTPHSANLIWTEVKQYGIFELIPIGLERKHRGEEVRIKQVDIENCSESDRLKFKLYNKVEGNKELSSKKRLFYNMTSYYKSVGENPFKYLPLTFHVTEGTKDTAFTDFSKKFNEFQKELSKDSRANNLWIVKPGEATNRGIGITVCSSIEEVAQVVDDKKQVIGMQRTYIVQKYLYRPMLYLNRKFDIRCYTLITFFDAKVTAYFYKEGYMRTSCQEFNMENVKDRFIHLTNDAVQKYSPDYGRFEDGNKLSYDEFQEYIDKNLNEKVKFKEIVYPKMKKIVTDTIKATHKKLDTKRRKYSFEVFGYDFMLDEMFNPWLLEVNTNPCLALSGHYLARLIPQMLGHALDIVLPMVFPGESEPQTDNLFEQIFLFRRN
jgi:tubulin--tyrosine ligase